MKVLNFGSLNIDYVYEVDHIVQPGETIASYQLSVFPGGKGLNQSVALAKAGVNVFHAGMIGEGGQFLLDTCKNFGVNTSLIERVQVSSGNAIIQLAVSGQNSIVLFQGANYRNTSDYINRVLLSFGTGDFLLLQNEINLLPQIVDCAYKKGMKIFLNPSPFNEQILECDLSKIYCLIMNEIEGAQITGVSNIKKILKLLRDKYPEVKVVLTLGEQGAVYQDKDFLIKQNIYQIPIVDTTAAGDTFTGYFISGLVRNLDIKECMDIAAKASAIAVSRKGASISVPNYQEVLNF